MLDIQNIKESNNIIDVISGFVELKRQGSGFVGLCPFHNEESPSLKVSESKQIFKCFGCGSSGDVVDFVQKIEGVTTNEALKIIDNGRTSEENPVKIVKPKKAVWIPKKPTHLPAQIVHPKLGIPSKTWQYKNENSEVISFVCRFDVAEGKKEVLPFTFATNGTAEGWRWMGLNKPRPLYNSDLIKAHPNATILVVEGEKTADACQSELNPQKTVVTTWIGGANGILNADFSSLNDRKIILWPDNDLDQKDPSGAVKPWHEQPGNKCMLEISKIIDPIQIVWTKNPEGLPNKWDAADKKWNSEKDELRLFIKENITEVPSVPVVEEVAPVVEENNQEPKKQQKELKMEAPKNPPLPPKVVQKTVSNESDHFRFLGYSKEDGKLVYHFFSFDAKSVVKMSPPAMSKSTLMTIAPLSFWERNYPGNKSKVDIDAVQQFLINTSHDLGTFQDKYIRGRGAWMDDNNLIIHTGTSLIIEGKKVALKSFRSRYVYEIGESLGFGFKNALKTAEASKLIDKLSFLNWEREINAYFLAGWCVIAPFCGVLNWRPHIWLTGPTGSGKSWTMEHIIKKLMGETAITVQGKTTEAGVRGLLQSDARPVLFDETDVDSHNDKERIQSVLSLARSSSYSDGGATVKGTQSGGSRSVMIRSCFALSSIGVQLNQQSDRSRFTVIGMVAFDKKQTNKEFLKFENEFLELVNDEFVNNLQARTLEILPIIISNAKIFADAAAHVIGNRRLGDQVGILLSGAYSLKSKNKISYDDAIKWVSGRDWSEETALEQTKDEFQLLALLMGKIVRVETVNNPVDRTIGELCLIASGKVSEPGLVAVDADNRLRRLGILINNGFVLIANTSDPIKSIIKDSSFSNNPNKILERLPGASKFESRTFSAGLKSRSIGFPVDLLGDIDSGSGGGPDDLPF
jgi:putative DNA primase/helicase